MLNQEVPIFSFIFSSFIICRFRNVLHRHKYYLASAAVDSLELIDQDYVLVSGPPIEASYSSTSASKPCHFPYRSESSLKTSLATMSSAPMPIIRAANNTLCPIGSLESQNSAPGTSHGSTDVGDALEQPSTHCMTRVKSLQKCASAITELVNEKVSHGMPTN